MTKVLIWGTGKTANTAMDYIKKDVEVLAFIDSYANEKDTFYGRKVIFPEEIKKYVYDWLIICSIYREEITKRLKDIKIEQNLNLVMKLEKEKRVQILVKTTL